VFTGLPLSVDAGTRCVLPRTQPIPCALRVLITIHVLAIPPPLFLFHSGGGFHGLAPGGGPWNSTPSATRRAPPWPSSVPRPAACRVRVLRLRGGVHCGGCGRGGALLGDCGVGGSGAGGARDVRRRRAPAVPGWGLRRLLGGQCQGTVFSKVLDGSHAPHLQDGAKGCVFETRSKQSLQIRWFLAVCRCGA